MFDETFFAKINNPNLVEMVLILKFSIFLINESIATIVAHRYADHR